MRIALFCEVFLPKVDGVVNTILRLLEHFANTGHESILFAPQGGPEKFGRTEIIGLPGFRFPLYPELHLVPPFVPIRRRLATFKPDLIHVINPISLGVAGIWYGQRTKTPTVASYHTDIPGFAERWGFATLSPLLATYIRIIHNQADLNLAPSNFTYRQLVAEGYHNLKLWTRGVDIQKFSPTKASPEWRARLSDHHPEATLLLYVGRLSAEKRVAWLHQIVKHFPQVRLAIVGDGPQRQELENQFSGTNTVFTGYLSGEALASAYASSDIFVFPGANETFGNAVLEAMASGLPVIAPNSGGVVDFIEHGQTGLLFDAESIESLLETLKQFVDTPSLITQFGEKAQLTAKARSWNIVFDGLIEDYVKVIHSSVAEQKRIKRWRQRTGWQNWLSGFDDPG